MSMRVESEHKHKCEHKHKVGEWTQVQEWSVITRMIAQSEDKHKGGEWTKAQGPRVNTSTRMEGTQAQECIKHKDDSWVWTQAR